MEHDDYLAFMMDALDGELTDSNQLELESHLRACPTCTREWYTLQAIDTLFRQAPILSPAADFTQRTLARLPNRRVRLWAMSLVYGLLLLSGILPMVLIVVALVRLVPVAMEPAVVSSIFSLMNKGFQVIGAVGGALARGLGQLVTEQPAVLGLLFVMAGIVFLWNGVYRQMVAMPNQRQIS
jgi:hypothetical protein